MQTVVVVGLEELTQEIRALRKAWTQQQCECDALERMYNELYDECQKLRDDVAALRYRMDYGN